MEPETPATFFIIRTHKDMVRMCRRCGGSSDENLREAFANLFTSSTRDFPVLRWAKSTNHPALARRQGGVAVLPRRPSGKPQRRGAWRGQQRRRQEEIPSPGRRAATLRSNTTGSPAN